MTTKNINRSATSAEQLLGISSERAKQLRQLCQQNWQKTPNAPLGEIAEQVFKQCNGEAEEMYVYGLLCAGTAYLQAYERTEENVPQDFNVFNEIDLARPFTWTKQGERVTSESGATTGQRNR